MQHFLQAVTLRASHCCVITIIFTRNSGPLVIMTRFPSRTTISYNHKYQKCFCKLNSKLCGRSDCAWTVMYTEFAGAALQDLAFPADRGTHQAHPTAAIIFQRQKCIVYTELVKFVMQLRDHLYLLRIIVYFLEPSFLFTKRPEQRGMTGSLRQCKLCMVATVIWLYFEHTLEMPAVKAKGLKRLKIHSKDGGTFSNNVKRPRNPKMTWMTNPTKPAIFGCFTNELSMQKKWICSREKQQLAGCISAGD